MSFFASLMGNKGQNTGGMPVGPMAGGGHTMPFGLPNMGSPVPTMGPMQMPGLKEIDPFASNDPSNDPWYAGFKPGHSPTGGLLGALSGSAASHMPGFVPDEATAMLTSGPEGPAAALDAHEDKYGGRNQGRQKGPDWEQPDGVPPIGPEPIQRQSPSSVFERNRGDAPLRGTARFGRPNGGLLGGGFSQQQSPFGGGFGMQNPYARRGW